MKIKHTRFIGYCLAIGLIAVLTLAMASCSHSSTTPTPTLSSIAVTPSAPTNLTIGSTQQFTATGIYSDGSNADISSQVTWNSDTVSVATISSTGLATGVATGTANITAVLSGVTSPAIVLTVISSTPTLSSIAVSPASPANLAVGSTQQFTATGTYSDGSTADISSQVTWNSDTVSVATISSTGLATGVATGTANITAVLSGVTSPAIVLTVISSTPTLSSIAVSPASPANLAVGSTQQFTATGTYSDGSTADISSQVTWNSDTVSVATISSTGLATGVATGTANITAVLSGVTSPAIVLTVISSTPTLSSIAVSPASPANLAVGSTQQFTATGTYSDGSTADISSQVTWNSDTVSVATISSTGLATGVATGTANITAALSGVTSLPVSLTVITTG